MVTGLTDDELNVATSGKQGYFLKHLKNDKIKVFKATIRLIEELKSKGAKIEVILSSKNLPYTLEKNVAIKLFDAVVSGNEITKGKPDPHVFLMAAEKIRVNPENCVEAAKRAKMLCSGVDRYNDPSRLRDADLVSSDREDINYGRLQSLFQGRG